MIGNGWNDHKNQTERENFWKNDGNLRSSMKEENSYDVTFTFIYQQKSFYENNSEIFSSQVREF